MKITVSEINRRPYDDGSGFREEIKARWHRDGEKDIAADVTIAQGEQRIVCTFQEWRDLRLAVDEAIAETGWVVPPTNRS